MFGRDDSKSQSQAVSVENEKVSKSARGCGIVFCGIFFLAGVAACTFTVLWPLYNAIDAMDWKETPCTITSSGVETHQGDDGNTYSIEITFRYEFNSREFNGGRYNFSFGSTNGYNGKKAVVDQYPVNAQTTCYVNSDDPTSAVLNRQIPLTILWGLISLPFLLIGGGGLLAIFGFIDFSKKKDKRFQWKSDRTIEGARGAHQLGESPARDFAPFGPVTLKPKSSPMGTLAMSLFVACFWNGIVSVFVMLYIEMLRNGKFEFMDVFLGLFLTPFVIVGVCLVVWVGHSILSLFNPRPTLTVSSASAAMGETIQVTWSFRGNTNSVRRLHIFIHGQEEARYQRGTDTQTDTETFAKLTIVDSTNFMDISNGEGEITIPTDTMHSFESNHNKIIWSIDVSGDIAWWPDVSASFPYTVMPTSKGATKP